MQFEKSIEEMVEHGWDEEVARKALLMQWQKDIEGKGGSRKDQKQFEKTVQVRNHDRLMDGCNRVDGLTDATATSPCRRTLCWQRV